MRTPTSLRIGWRFPDAVGEGAVVALPGLRADASPPAKPRRPPPRRVGASAVTPPFPPSTPCLGLLALGEVRGKGDSRAWASSRAVQSVSSGHLGAAPSDGVYGGGSDFCVGAGGDEVPLIINLVGVWWGLAARGALALLEWGYATAAGEAATGSSRKVGSGDGGRARARRSTVGGVPRLQPRSREQCLSRVHWPRNVFEEVFFMDSCPGLDFSLLIISGRMTRTQNRTRDPTNGLWLSSRDL